MTEEEIKAQQEQVEKPEAERKKAAESSAKDLYSRCCNQKRGING